MERSKTHIDILDQSLNGGIPKNSIVLLHGPPGTGKTTLALQYLIGGAKLEGEKGIYMTLLENEMTLTKNFSSFSFFDKAIFDQDMVEIIDLRYTTQKGLHKKEKFTFFETLGLFSFLEEKVKQTNAKRIVIDSINALSVFIKNDQDMRDFFFYLSNIIYQLDCTLIIISEGENSAAYNSTHFMCGGIIRLDQIEKNNVLVKTLEIPKMRGTFHSSDRMRLDITNDGIKLLPLIKG